jgi:hypothetical protein
VLCSAFAEMWEKGGWDRFIRFVVVRSRRCMLVRTGAFAWHLARVEMLSFGLDGDGLGGEASNVVTKAVMVDAFWGRQFSCMYSKRRSHALWLKLLLRHHAARKRGFILHSLESNKWGPWDDNSLNLFQTKKRCYNEKNEICRHYCQGMRKHS